MIKQLITIAVLLVFSLPLMAQEDIEPMQTIMHIAPYQQDCVGVGAQQCLIVRFEDDDNLTFFYDQIEGFTFEEGFEYTLLVNITERENVPADASSLAYELVEVVQQFPAHLGGKVWELQSLNGTDIEDPTRYTLILTEDGLAIKADCNSVQANLTFNPFNIETTVSTRVACPEDSLETEYLAGLNATNMVSVENGELILQSSEGQLRFAPPSIVDTEWTLIRVLSMAMMVELDDTLPYTLQIVDNMATMTIDCNQAGGTVEFNQGVLHFSDVYSTLMACANDPVPFTFPPESAVYYINEAGHLILEDSMTTLYEFINVEAE
ncbi:MAG: META domain-containing protein [Aggregatilineales bacterium]